MSENTAQTGTLTAEREILSVVDETLIQPPTQDECVANFIRFLALHTVQSGR